MCEVAWSTKTVATQKRSEFKKSGICSMIPGVLDIKASKDVLSPAAISDSLLIIQADIICLVARCTYLMHVYKVTVLF